MSRYVRDYPYGYMKCPNCNKPMRFAQWTDNSIKVTVESEQDVVVPGMLLLNKNCRNPFCKWSTVEP